MKQMIEQDVIVLKSAKMFKEKILMETKKNHFYYRFFYRF